jgi:hypothetical protein
MESIQDTLRRESNARDPITGSTRITALGVTIGWRTTDGVFLSPTQFTAYQDEWVRINGKPGGRDQPLFDKIVGEVGQVVKHFADEYVHSDPKTIATHLLFKNEIITTGMEIAESRAERGDTGWVGAVGAVSESMDKKPGSNALMAIGGGLAWMTGGMTLTLLTVGAKDVLGDAAKSVQAQADQKASEAQSQPGRSPPSTPTGTDFLSRLWTWILHLLSLLGLGSVAPTPSQAPTLPAEMQGVNRLGKK